MKINGEYLMRERAIAPYCLCLLGSVRYVNSGQQDGNIQRAHTRVRRIPEAGVEVGGKTGRGEGTVPSMVA